MKTKILIFIIIVLTGTVAFMLTKINKPSTEPDKTQIIVNNVYKFYPTQKIWTFIKLDTRNGKMWQAQ